MRLLLVLMLTLLHANAEAAQVGAEHKLIAEWARTGQPGDIVPLSGTGLDAPGLHFSITSRGLDTVQYMSDAVPVSVRGANVAAFVLPATLPADSTYHVTPWIGNRSAATFDVNAPEVWWVGPRSIEQGSIGAIYGRNLTDKAGTPRILFVFSQERTRTIKVLDANPYRIRFLVPNNLESGTYRLEARDAASSIVLVSDLEVVVAAPNRDARPPLNVMLYGARGDGMHDDGTAIERADAAARAAGLTLYFPRGQYLIHSPIALGSNTHWRGDGPGQSIVRFNLAADAFRGIPGKPAALTNLDRDVENIAFEELGLELANDPANSDFTFIYLRRTENLTFNRVALDARSNDDADLTGGRFIHFRNSSIAGRDLFVGDARYVDIQRCNIKLTHDTHASIIVSGGEFISISESYFDSESLDEDGDGRIFTLQGHSGSARNIYFGHNISTNIAPGPHHNNQNSGEQVLIEMSTPLNSGRVAAAGSDWLKIGSNESGHRESSRSLLMNMTIVAGQGVGQTRRISRLNAEEGIYTVSPPWFVAPDATSSFLVSAVAENVVVYGNRLSGRADWNQHHTASAGVQCYGDCHQVVISRNRIADVRFGISLWAQAPDNHMTTVTYFTYSSENTITNANVAFAYISRNLPKVEMPETIGLLGNVESRNMISHVVDAGILIFGCRPSVGWEMLMNASNADKISSVLEDVVIINQKRPDRSSSFQQPVTSLLVLPSALSQNRIAYRGEMTRRECSIKDIGFE